MQEHILVKTYDFGVSVLILDPCRSMTVLPTVPGTPTPSLAYELSNA